MRVMICTTSTGGGYRSQAAVESQALVGRASGDEGDDGNGQWAMGRASRSVEDDGKAIGRARLQVMMETAMTMAMGRAHLQAMMEMVAR
ncbi:hypothetical protein GOP47_0018412 [Adiantum capillus-veneris]|uniref:Uncharacterized protein n=1 Tax=Adiantum capillus-veneris TaxID=13818 RepID=A0A9D4UD25_ADICA|nr:hypothetical protein GOP47_0018412 [Adiantum capillus-veneris]